MDRSNRQKRRPAGSRASPMACAVLNPIPPCDRPPATCQLRVTSIETAPHCPGAFDPLHATGTCTQGKCVALSSLAAASSLTPREEQVLSLVCEGLKNDTIASRLAISPATARLHIRNLHHKTGTADKVEIVLLAWQHCMKRLKTAAP